MGLHVEEKELLVLLFGIGVLIFAVANRQRLRKLPAWRVLWASFCAVLAAWTLTVLKALFWPQLLDLLEHLCYAGSAALAAVWCWLAFAAPAERGHETAGRDG